VGIKSGAIAGALSAPFQIWAMRWQDTSKYLVPVKLRIEVVCTAFSTGVSLDFAAYCARSYTANASGGSTITAPTKASSGKMNTSIFTSNGELRTASTTQLTAGTQTLDAAPIATGVVQIKAAQDCGAIELFNWSNSGQYPIQLGNNEGIVIRVESFDLAASNTIQVRGIFQWLETPYSIAG
jgi:hypothetical protein